MVTMSSHNNGNKKPAAVETTTQSNLFEICTKYLWKYVQAPLLFWEDGNPVIANTKQKSIHGLIFEIKQRAGRNPRTIVGIHVAPYDDELDSQTRLSLEVVMKMMMPFDFAPESGDFFYNTDSEGNNTETDDENYTPKEAANKKQKISPKKNNYCSKRQG